MLERDDDDDDDDDNENDELEMERDDDDKDNDGEDDKVLLERDDNDKVVLERDDDDDDDEERDDDDDGKDDDDLNKSIEDSKESRLYFDLRKKTVMIPSRVRNQKIEERFSKILWHDLNHHSKVTGLASIIDDMTRQHGVHGAKISEEELYDLASHFKFCLARALPKSKKVDRVSAPNLEQVL